MYPKGSLSSTKGVGRNRIPPAQTSISSIPAQRPTSARVPASTRWRPNCNLADARQGLERFHGAESLRREASMTLSSRTSSLAARHRALCSALEDCNGMGTTWLLINDIYTEHHASSTKAQL